MSNLKVGEVVELHYKGRMVLGNGSLVKILSICGESAVITTGCGEWLERLVNLRKTQ